MFLKRRFRSLSRCNVANYNNVKRGALRTFDHRGYHIGRKVRSVAPPVLPFRLPRAFIAYDRRGEVGNSFERMLIRVDDLGCFTENFLSRIPKHRFGSFIPVHDPACAELDREDGLCQTIIESIDKGGV